MQRHLDLELDQIRNDLLRMGGQVEDMIAQAFQALLERDSIKAGGVVRRDIEADRMEKHLDDAVNAILATQQPTAVDLRLLVAIMKITGELERIGDSAVNIAQGVEILNEQPPLKPYIDLPRMAELSREMVRNALDAFVRRDAQLALGVCESDDRIDGLYKQLFRELLTFMIEDPKTISRALQLLLIARNLERVADHATNIAEDVIYYVEGRDIRHPQASEG